MKILQEFIALLLLAIPGGLPGPNAHADGLTLTSPQIKEGELINQQQVFSGYGCAGGNVSPALSWRGVPTATKSPAVTGLVTAATNGRLDGSVGHLPPGWRMLEESRPHEAETANRIAWTLEVATGDEATLTYRVQVTRT